MLIAEHDELLEFTWLTVQAIETPDHHPITPAELDIGQQALILRAGFLGVVRAEVVDIYLSDAPTSSLRFSEPIRFLTPNAEALARGSLEMRA